MSINVGQDRSPEDWVYKSMICEDCIMRIKRINNLDDATIDGYGICGFQAFQGTIKTDIFEDIDCKGTVGRSKGWLNGRLFTLATYGTFSHNIQDLFSFDVVDGKLTNTQKIVPESYLESYIKIFKEVCPAFSVAQETKMNRIGLAQIKRYVSGEEDFYQGNLPFWRLNDSCISQNPLSAITLLRSSLPPDSVVHKRAEALVSEVCDIIRNNAGLEAVSPSMINALRFAGTDMSKHNLIAALERILPYYGITLCANYGDFVGESKEFPFLFFDWINGLEESQRKKAELFYMGYKLGGDMTVYQLETEIRQDIMDFDPSIVLPARMIPSEEFERELRAGHAKAAAAFSDVEEASPALKQFSLPNFKEVGEMSVEQLCSLFSTYLNEDVQEWRPLFESNRINGNVFIFMTKDEFIELGCTPKIAQELYDLLNTLQCSKS